MLILFIRKIDNNLSLYPDNQFIYIAIDIVLGISFLLLSVRATDPHGEAQLKSQMCVMNMDNMCLPACVCVCVCVCEWGWGVGCGSDKDAFYAQRPLPN